MDPSTDSNPRGLRDLYPVELVPMIKALVRKGLLFGFEVVFFALGSVSRFLRQFRAASPTSIRSIRLVRLDLLGDAVFSLPVARRIKESFPDVRVSMVTLPGTSPIVELSPDVDRVITVDTNRIRSPRAWLQKSTYRQLYLAWRQLRSERPDVTLSLYGKTASFITFISRSALRIGYADEAYRNLVSPASGSGRRSMRRRMHDSRFSLELLDEIDGIFRKAECAPRIESSAADNESATALLAEVGIRKDSKFVVAHAGSHNGESKRWPASSFAVLAHRLAEDGVPTVLVGSSEESDLARAVAESGDAVSIAGRTSIPELVAVLRRASLIVSGDSGPLHIATALGVPAVAIYGPTDPAINGPIAWHGQPVQVLRRDIVCSPCYSVRVRAECPLGDPICMRLVTPTEVYEAVSSLLATTS